ncbi:MAG: tetratricopeptide repeat protein [Elusimicrobia bacterium]|nr:tetratricopeptide repeat protein [Elusimicrobiota bacterium]
MQNIKPGISENKNIFADGDRILPLIVFITALILRFVYFYQIRGFGWTWNPSGDAFFYDSWADGIIRGGFMKGYPYYMSPGMAYLLAAVYYVLGHNLFAVLFIQFIAGSVNCVLVYYLARILFNRKTGLIAGLLACGYGMSFVLESIPVTAVWINLLNLAMLILLLKSLEKNNRLLALGAGFAAGLSSLFRPSVLLFAVMLALWKACRDIKMKKGADYGWLAAFIAAIIITISPVSARNCIVSGEFIPLTVSGGMNFYVGNNKTANGSYRAAGFKEVSDPFFMVSGYRDRTSQIAGRSMSYRETDSYWRSKAFGYIKDSFPDWINLVLRKFVLFFNNTEISTNRSFQVYRGDSPLLSMKLISYGFLCPAGILGMLLAVKKKGRTAVMRLYVLSYLAICLIFFTVSEYRYPAAAVFAVYAAHAISGFLEKIRQKKPGTAMGYALAMGLLCLGANAPGAIDMKPYSAAARYNRGLIYYEEEKYPEALSEFTQSLKENPFSAAAHNNIGNIYFNQGRYDLAVEEYEEALRIDPSCACAYNNIGRVYHVSGREEKAVTFYEKAVELDPSFAQPYYNLGIIYYAEGNNSAALKMFGEMLKYRYDEDVLKKIKKIKKWN